MGGEEFLVVVSGSSSPEILELAERVRGNIETITISSEDIGISHQITTSIGVFSYVPQRGDTVELYLEQVDAALYKAKNSGRNVVVSANGF